MEVSLTGKPIVQRDFSWDVTLNFSYNKGRLGSFPAGRSLFFIRRTLNSETIKAASVPNGGYFLGMTGTPVLTSGGC